MADASGESYRNAPGYRDRGDAFPFVSADMRRDAYTRLDYDTVRRACAHAGAEEAFARDFDVAQYYGPPRLYRDRGLELRGRMRLEDRRGYVIVDTVCELDANGSVWRFALLR